MMMVRFPIRDCARCDTTVAGLEPSVYAQIAEQGLRSIGKPNVRLSRLEVEVLGDNGASVTVLGAALRDDIFACPSCGQLNLVVREAVN